MFGELYPVIKSACRNRRNGTMISRQGANVQNLIGRLYKSAKSKKTILMVLSCVVVFITTYALILPAITLEQDEAAKQGGIDVPAQSDSNAGKGYEITADFDKAGLPENVELAAEEITGSDQDYNALYQDALQAVQEDSGNKISDLAFAKFYDISLYSDGECIEPDGPVDVTISYDKALKAKDAENVRIVHFALDEETGEVVPEVLDSKRVEAEVKGGKLTETTFEATSFSVYAIVYTVDFEYDVDGKKYTYSIEGGSKINLADLLLQLQVIGDDPDTEADEVQLFMDEIDKVEFSSPKLVRVEQEDSDWTLTSLKPFDSTETLTVTMKNGDVFTVKVTDAQEISGDDEIDVNSTYIICIKDTDGYHVLKADGTTDPQAYPDTSAFVENGGGMDKLGSEYQWTFYYVFTEKDRETSLDYTYYLIRPENDKTKTIALNDAGEDLVQTGTNNVAVIPQEGGGFVFLGYNHSDGTHIELGYDNGAFCSFNHDEQPSEANRIRIFKQDPLAKYEFTVVSDNYVMGSVSTTGTPLTKQDKIEQQQLDGSYKIVDGNVNYYLVETDNGKKNNYPITAVPGTHTNSQGQNKWEFDYWDLNGEKLEGLQATIPAGTLDIPRNGSVLTAHFKQKSASDYSVPDNEKEGSAIEDMAAWLTELKNRPIPLNAKGTKKTAEVYDYENRIYRVDLTAQSSLTTFDGIIDLGFMIDVSGSMNFPSLLDDATDVTGEKDLSTINNRRWNGDLTQG